MSLKKTILDYIRMNGVEEELSVLYQKYPSLFREHEQVFREFKDHLEERHERTVSETLAHAEHQCITSLVGARLGASLHPPSLAGMKRVQSQIFSTLSRSVYTKKDYERIIQDFRKSQRRIICIDCPHAPLTLCLLKTHGEYGGNRKRPVFIFLNTENDHVLNRDGHNDTILKKRFRRADALVRHGDPISDDTNHALFFLLHRLNNVAIVSESTIPEFFVMFTKNITHT